MAASTETPGKQRLGPDFFARPTLRVARDLLGRHLVRVLDGRRLVVRVTETEAYVGQEDRACHASRGKTPRSRGLWEKPGTLYVYLVYGLHWCANVVTEREGFPAAVLLRGGEALEGLERMRELAPRALRGSRIVGPGRLTKALGIDGALHGEPLSSELGFERGRRLPDVAVRSTPRVGVDYAGEWAKRPWRFVSEE